MLEFDDDLLNEASDLGMLRRVPTQGRSRAKMLRILDAAESLLRTVGYDRLVGTPSLILEEADVTGGSFYSYFGSVQAVIEIIGLRQIRLVKTIIDQAAERDYASWEEASDAIIDAYVAHHWGDRAVREVWSSHQTPRLQAIDQEGDRYVAQRIRDVMIPLSGPEASHGSDLPYRLLVSMHDHSMRLAFRIDERGDPEAIAQIKIASRAYLATVLSPRTDNG